MSRPVKSTFLMIMTLIYGSLFIAKASFAHLPADADNIISLNFDLDGNVLNPPTLIVVFHKVTGEELHLDGAHFAENHNTRYTDYEVRLTEDSALSSFRFANFHERNHYLNDILKALESPTVDMLGPVFVRFYFALKNSRALPWLSIVTARGHNPAQMHEGHLHLHQLGLLPATPHESNIHPVSFLFKPTEIKVPEGKILVLEKN